MSKKKLKILLAVLIPVAVIAILVGVVYSSLKQYHDRNTWAVVSVSGSVSGETDDAFEEQKELLKGETLVFENVILEVTNVDHDGTISFIVKQGNLYDESGDSVKKLTLNKGEKVRYRIDGGSVYLEVISNYYA